MSIYNFGSIKSPSHLYHERMTKFPNNLRHYRETAKLSQESLAKLVGRTKDAVSKWERGERKLTIEEARRLAPHLGVSAGQIADDVQDNYTADEELMEHAAKAILSAAKVMGMRIDLAVAMACTVKLYNHVKEFRRRGENITPTESSAALILKSVV